MLVVIAKIHKSPLPHRTLKQPMGYSRRMQSLATRHWVRRVLPVCLLAGLLGSHGVNAADTAAFPAREIKILIGYPPGSASELSLRALAHAAAKYFKKTLIVINKPGASQSIALGALASAAPDGHTMAMTTDTDISLTSHQQKLQFDPRLLRVLLGYATLKHVLFVRSDFPNAKYEDLVAYGKTSGAVLNFGGTGEGTSPDLITKAFRRSSTGSPRAGPT